MREKNIINFILCRQQKITGEKMTISDYLLEILVCPKCKKEISLDEKKNAIICKNCSLLYEIKDDIPIMLIDKAKPL